MSTTENPAKAILEEQIKAIEDEQQPTRDKIAELEASLKDGEATIDRLTNAIRALDGLPPLTTRKTAATATPGRQRPRLDDEKFLAFLAEQEEPVTKHTLVEHFGVSAATIDARIKKFKETEQIKEGEPFTDPTRKGPPAKTFTIA